MPNLKEGMYSINTFSEGMNMDIHPSLAKNSTYQYAENIRIVTNDDGSTGVACNYDGVETIYDMRIFHVDPDKKTDDGKYTPSKNDERIIHVDSCRQYAVVFTREKKAGESNAYIDRIYILDFTKDPNERPIFSDKTAIDGLYRNSNKDVFIKDKKTGEWKKDEDRTNVTYQYNKYIDEELGHNLVPLNKYGTDTSPWNNHFFCTLVRVGEYGIQQPISSTMIYESDTNVKIYWADGHNQIQSMNILDAYDGYYMKNSSKDSTSIVPQSPYNSMFLADVIPGSLKSGSYRYAYYLTNAGGSQSGVSLPTGPIFVYDGMYGEIGKFREGEWATTATRSDEASEPKETDSGLRLKAYIPKELLDAYSYITVIRCHTPGLVKSAGDASWESFQPVPIDGRLEYEEGDDSGGAYIAIDDNGGDLVPIKNINDIYAGNSALSVVFMPRYLEQKDNILFAANLVEPQTASSVFNVSDNGEVPGLDFRSYPFNRYGCADIRMTNADGNEQWKHIEVGELDEKGPNSVNMIKVIDDDRNLISDKSDCYIPYDEISNIETVSKAQDEHNTFFNYGFDKTFDFDTSVYSDPLQNPENAGKYWIGGCGPIVSYEFVTKEIAISDNKTYDFYGLNTAGSHQLSHENGRVFDPKSDGDWDNKTEITVNGSYIPTSVDGGLVKFSPSKYTVEIEEDYLNGLKYAGGYNNPFIISNFRSLKRNEVYRYIIAFRTLGGKRCATFWIGDIKTPSSTVIPYFTVHKSSGNGYDDMEGDGSMVFANVLGIKFKFDIDVMKEAMEKHDISFQSIDSFEILRASRSAFGDGTKIENGTVIATGVLQSLFHNTDGRSNWQQSVDGPLNYELAGNENSAYYYDEHNTSLQPTWFVTSYGSPKCFFPSRIDRNRGDAQYNDILNNIPYRTQTNADTGSSRSGITINWGGGNTLYSGFVNGDRSYRKVNDKFDYGKSSFGSLFPASRNSFGIISPEFDYAMAGYISEAKKTPTCIDVSGKETKMLNDNLSAPIDGSIVVGNTALFSAAAPDYAEGDGTRYADITIGTRVYGRDDTVVTLPFYSLFLPMDTRKRQCAPVKTNKSYFRAFSSLDVYDNNEGEHALETYHGTKDTHNGYDGEVYVKNYSNFYSANKSAGFSFAEASPLRSEIQYGNKGESASMSMSAGGISTGCCDGTVVHSVSVYDEFKDWDSSLPAGEFLKKIFDGFTGHAGTFVRDHDVVTHLATMSGGQNMVGRYYYQSPVLKSTYTKYDQQTKSYMPEDDDIYPDDITFSIDDYKYARAIETDRGRYNLDNDNIMCNISGSKYTTNTSIFTYAYTAPLSNYYAHQTTNSGLSTAELDAIRIAVAFATAGASLVFGLDAWLQDINGTRAILSKYKHDKMHGQNMICLTGGNSGSIVRGRTSPSHGQMVYVTTKDTINNITGCYASRLLNGLQNESVNGLSNYYDVMDYTTTLVVDVKRRFSQLGLNKARRQQITYMPAGGALIPLEYNKFKNCNTQRYATSAIINDGEVYPSTIEQTIFSGDEYICIYDYTSTYLTRAKSDKLNNKFGTINCTSANNDEETDKSHIVAYQYDKEDEVFYGGRNEGPCASCFTEENISAQVQALIPIESRANISLMYGYIPSHINGEDNIKTQRFEGSMDRDSSKPNNEQVIDHDETIYSKLGASKDDYGPYSAGELYTSIVSYNKKFWAETEEISPINWRAGSYYDSLNCNSGSVSGDSEPGPVNGLNPIVSLSDYIIDGDIIQNSMSSTKILGSGNFDCRIRYSKEKVINESSDSYHTFLQDDFMDVDSRFGPITGLYRFNDKLYLWQDSSFASIPVNERQLLNDEDTSNTALLIGTGGVLKQPPTYITTENGIASSVLDNYGIMNYASGVYTSSDNAIYWYDHNKHEVLMYKGGIGQLSKMKGFQSWLNKYHDGFNAKLAFTYNPKYKEILMTFIPRDDMYHRADKSVQEPASTIVYNELIDAPMTFVTNNPTFYVRQFDGLYSFDKTAILRKHNVDSCIDAAKLRFVANESPTVTKVFDNVEYTAEFREPGLNFTTINFEAPSMVSNNVEFIGRREDNYRFAIPRAKSDSEYMYPNRMKGKYLIENFEFNNGGGEFKLPSVITTFRSSYI